MNQKNYISPLKSIATLSASAFTSGVKDAGLQLTPTPVTNRQTAAYIVLCYMPAGLSRLVRQWPNTACRKYCDAL